MKFEVVYSLEKDINNYLSAAWKFKYLKHGRKKMGDRLLRNLPEAFKKDLKSAQTEAEATKYIKKYLKYLQNKEKGKIEKVVKELQTQINNSSSEIIKKLEQVYGKKYPFRKITIYLTTLGICPYNYQEKWFMIPVYASQKQKGVIILHELNHFLFYHYFNSLKNQLGKEKFESLKEGLTVFTNPEEKGYPNQQKLRQWLKKQKGSISEIIEKGAWRKYL